MALCFTASLINPQTQDPGLFVRVNQEKRAFLFDCGSMERLGKKNIQHVSLVFISHTHIDHFIGFDLVLRYNIGLNKTLKIFGPPQIAEQVQHKILSYNWNLLTPDNANFLVYEIHEHEIKEYSLYSSEFYRKLHLREVIERKDSAIYHEKKFSVFSACLDHKTPSLAYSLREKDVWRVDKEKLNKFPHSPGGWLKELKEAVAESPQDDSLFLKIEGKEYSLTDLKNQLLLKLKGQKICYVTDTIYNEKTASAILDLAFESDLFFCECHFADEDLEKATNTFHLTTSQAGELGRKAKAKKLIGFHYSSKYTYQQQSMIKQELRAAFSKKN